MRDESQRPREKWREWKSGEGVSFRFSRDQNRETRSSVFLCSETKRKRLLRRLCGYHEDSFISCLELHFRLQVRRLKIVVNTNLLLTWIRCKGRCTNLVHPRGKTSLLLMKYVHRWQSVVYIKYFVQFNIFDINLFFRRCLPGND